MNHPTLRHTLIHNHCPLHQGLQIKINILRKQILTKHTVSFSLRLRKEYWGGDIIVALINGWTYDCKKKIADIQINLDPGHSGWSYLSNTSYCVGMASNKPILQDLCCLYTRKRNRKKINLLFYPYSYSRFIPIPETCTCVSNDFQSKSRTENK